MHLDNQSMLTHDDLPNKEVKKWLVILALTAIAFIISLFLPLMTLSKLIIFNNTVSIASSVYDLLLTGHYFLLVLISGFSIFLPLLKLFFLYQILIRQLSHTSTKHLSQRVNKLLHLLHEYGRWGMLDVFVVAIIIMTVKLGAIANVEVHIGLYVFGCSVFMMMLITNRIVKWYDKISIVKERY